jgi:hypothetical protein
MMNLIERAFYSGRIGLTDEMRVEPMGDIYEQTDNTHFQFADTEADRLTRRHCPHPECNTAFRDSDLHEPDADRCPFCHRLI